MTRKAGGAALVAAQSPARSPAATSAAAPAGGRKFRKLRKFRKNFFQLFFFAPLALTRGFCYTCNRQQRAGPSEEARGNPIPLRIERKKRMKKLMFVAALAASAAAFAEGPINATAFANPEEYNPNAANSYFYFAGESDSSTVTNESPSTSKHTANFATAADSNYLALDTEGSTLWRSLNTIESETVEGTTTYSLGTATNVAQTGTYLDTLVQFTVTEDEAPEVTTGDKLAIWLQFDETTGKTNLMVKAKAWALDGSMPTGTAASFTVSNVTVEPGMWYRLTVKAVQTVIDPSTGMIIPAFQIFIDGTEVAATTPQISTEIQDMFTGNVGTWVEGMAALASANKLFPSLAADPATLTDVTLQGVGFQGTGAIDEIVWTEEDPFPAATVNFTLTWGEGISAVAYTLSSDLSTTNSLTSGTAVALAPGDGTATIKLIPTFASGYEFDKLMLGETDLSALEFAIPSADATATLVAKAANPTVDGQSVEPANVFNTAASNKPIIYPSAPTIAGEVGSQTIAFNGVTVNVPAYYTATLDGTTVMLELNDNALPTIGDEMVSGEAKDAIEVGATTFTATLTSTNVKLYYGLKSAATVNAAAADWTVGTLTQGTGAPMQITADKPTVEGNAAAAGFFKVYVTDVPPAAVPVVEP